MGLACNRKNPPVACLGQAVSPMEQRAKNVEPSSIGKEMILICRAIF